MDSNTVWALKLHLYNLEIFSSFQLENLDSALIDLKSALKTTNNDLAELNSTHTKVKSFPALGVVETEKK